MQCWYCKKSGHSEAYCWTKQRDEQKHANLSEKVEDESKLFMVHSQTTNNSDGVLIIDSGYSNHMSGTKSLFREFLMSREKVKFDLVMTSKYELKAGVP